MFAHALINTCPILIAASGPDKLRLSKQGNDGTIVLKTNTSLHKDTHAGFFSRDVVLGGKFLLWGEKM